MAIANIAADNDANCEALRPYIPVIIARLEQHASDPKVSEAGLATVYSCIYDVYTYGSFDILYMYITYIIRINYNIHSL